MGIINIDHKDDVKKVLYSIKDIDINKLDTNSLEKALEQYITRKFVEELSINGKNKINNIPLDINNEHMLYLSIKLELDKRLYLIVDFKIDEKDKNKDIKIEVKKECLSNIKVLSEIFLYYFDKGDNETIYKILSIIDFNEKQTDRKLSRISYYLEQIGKNKNEILNKSGYNLKYCSNNFPKFQGNLDKFKKLFFD